MSKLNLMCGSWGETLLGDLNTMRHGKEMCDVKLVLQGGAVSLAHSPVLAAASPFFKSILDGAENPELNMEDFPREVIRQVLEFVYTGSVDVDMTDLCMLHTVAVDLNIKLLQDMVEQVMQSFPKSEFPEKVEVLEALTDHIKMGDKTDAEETTEVTECVADDVINIPPKDNDNEDNEDNDYPMEHDDLGDVDDNEMNINQDDNISEQHEESVPKSSAKMDLSWNSPLSNVDPKPSLLPTIISSVENGEKEADKHDSIIVIAPNTPVFVPPELAKHRKPKRHSKKRPVMHGVVLRECLRAGVNKGVFTTTPFPDDLSFGPYDKEVDSKSETPNWLRFIKLAASAEEGNVQAYDYKAHTFFKTTKVLEADTELLLWCGEEERERLGILQPNDTERDATILGNDVIYLPIGDVWEPPEMRFDCERCNMSWVSDIAYHKHMRQKHDIPLPVDIYLRVEQEKLDKSQSAPVENSIGPDNEAMSELRKIIEPQRAFRNNARIHYNRTGKDRNHACPVCNNKFFSAASLRTHALTHTKEKPFSCHICGRGFSQKGNLTTHLMIHTGEKKFKCDKCGKGFSEASNFRRHWRTHTGDKPYLCFTCGRRFTQFAHLETHIRKHTGERPFVCITCNKGFREKSSLHIHMKRHGERNYLCTVCNKTFFTSCELVNHRKAQHGVPKSPALTV